MLVRGRCREGGEIQCLFNGSSTTGRYVDNNTLLCTTPVVNTLGSVGLNLRRFDRTARVNAIIASTTFTNGTYKDYSSKSIILVLLFLQFPQTDFTRLTF